MTKREEVPDFEDGALDLPKPLKAAKPLRPDSLGDCKRLLMLTEPPLDHKLGYYAKTCEFWAGLFGIKPKKFWREFGINTVAKDISGFKKKKEYVYYKCDVERTIRKCICPKYVSIEEWD